MKRHKLVILSESEISERAKQKIIELMDDAYRKGENITQRDVEKILSKPPYNMSHGFICKKIKQMRRIKKIISWQQNGVNHLEFAPKIPYPFKIAVIFSVIVFVMGVFFDVSISPSIASPYAYMYENEVVEYSPFAFQGITIAVFMIFSFFFMAWFWHRKTGKYINHRV